MFYFAESREPVTPDTVFSLASTAKHFTSALLGQSLRNAGLKNICLA